MGQAGLPDRRGICRSCRLCPTRGVATSRLHTPVAPARSTDPASTAPASTDPGPTKRSFPQAGLLGVVGRE